MENRVYVYWGFHQSWQIGIADFSGISKSLSDGTIFGSDKALNTQ